MTTATTSSSAGNAAVRPFSIDVPQADIDDLAVGSRRALAREGDRRGSDSGRAAGHDAGARPLLGHRLRLPPVRDAAERPPQFITEIDGLDIHFIHVRSPHENALPLIITHGWPGSVIEMLNVDRPAHRPDHPRRHCRGRLRRGDPVDAGLRVLRQAADDRLGPRAHRPRLDRADEAPRLYALRGAGRRLGSADHRRDG